MRDPGGHDQAGPCLLSYEQSCDLCAHRNSLPRYSNNKIYATATQKASLAIPLSLDEVFFPQMASPMTFQSWPPSEHQALRTKGSCSPPTVRMAASSSLSRFQLILIRVEFEQLFFKVARRLVFIYKGDGGGGKERLRFKLKLSLNK